MSIEMSFIHFYIYLTLHLMFCNFHVHSAGVLRGKSKMIIFILVFFTKTIVFNFYVEFESGTLSFFLYFIKKKIIKSFDILPVLSQGHQE